MILKTQRVIIMRQVVSKSGKKILRTPLSYLIQLSSKKDGIFRRIEKWLNAIFTQGNQKTPRHQLMLPKEQTTVMYSLFCQRHFYFKSKGKRSNLQNYFPTNLYYIKMPPKFILGGDEHTTSQGKKRKPKGAIMKRCPISLICTMQNCAC